jgi:hypothetical protein
MIVAEFALGSEVVEWIFDQLVVHSPVKTGRYQRTHLIYADGVEVSGPEETYGADEVVITNVVPYARKIERGQSKQAPNEVYEGVAAMGAKRYSNLAKIRFTYRAPIGGTTDLEKWAVTHAARSAGNQRRQYLKNVQQPAILISFR